VRAQDRLALAYGVLGTVTRSLGLVSTCFEAPFHDRSSLLSFSYALPEQCVLVLVSSLHSILVPPARSRR
jgi:hypothetical protein